MDIEKFRAKIQAKLDQQQKEWDQMLADRKKADAESAQKFTSEMEKATKNYMENYGKKFFGSYWKQ